ncbi:hypothetical protein D621_00220 [beta proteobacterium AAP51]|nr:hypothetical protein D621_00220 [beta proteobacterium AAP51]
MGILEQVERLSGRPVHFKPDSSLSLRATMKMARDGAPAHVLQYRPSNEPIDYWVAVQAGYVLRLFELPPEERFDFAGTGRGLNQVQAMLETGTPLDDDDRNVLPKFAELVLHWALMNLRSFAVGMRIDQWIRASHPELATLQAAGVEALQQENLQLLSKRLGNLSIPVPLLGMSAATAMFADRLLGKGGFAIPFRAAGSLAQGAELLDLFDRIPSDAAHDRALVDAWADALGMTAWYTWVPYKS